MKDRIWTIAGPLTGIIFAVLAFASAGIVGSAGVELSDPSVEIARAFEERSGRVVPGSIIGLLGVTFFFGFLAYFRRRLQKAEGEGGWLASVAYGGGLVTAAILLVDMSMQLATTSVSADVDPVVAKVFMVYGWNYSLVFAPPMVAFALGASLVIVRYATLSRWTGWLGFLVTLALLIMPWIGAALLVLWVLLVSVALLIRDWTAIEPTAMNP